MDLSPKLEDPIAPGLQEGAPRRSRKFRWILAGVVFCGLVCVAVGAIFVFEHKVHNNAADITANIQQAPGLRVTLTAKRESMAFNGQTTAQVYIVPHAASSTGSLTFDAYLSQVGPDVTENYVLLNGRAYKSTVEKGAVTAAQCLTASQIPPVQLMQTSLSNSLVVDAVEGSSKAPSCDTGKLLQLVFAGEKFVFCNSPDNKLTQATGTDLDLTIEYLADPTKIPDFDIPRVAGAAELDCPVVVSESEPTSMRRRLSASSSAMLEVVKGNVRRTTLESSSCGCKGPMKPCLFVHGLGNFFDAPLSSTDLLYWGLAHQHVPCCSSVKFAHFETIHNGWDEPRVQNQFCDAALATSKSSTRTVGSIILITHSMGNLIASASVASGVCNFSNQVSWLSVAGPMQGSRAANLLQDKCNSNSWIDIPLAGAASLLGFCPAPQSFLSLKHQETVDARLKTKYAQAQAIRQKYATKTLCGVDPWGLNTPYAPIMYLVNKMAHHGSGQNDGMVDYPSCAAGLSGFSTNPTGSGNYVARINHADATFRNGDGWWGLDRKPLKWLECAL